MILTLGLSNLSATNTDNDKLNAYISKKVSILDYRISKNLKKQHKMFYRIKQEELKADSYDSNVESYERTINCIESATSKSEIKICESDLKKDLTQNKLDLDNQITEQIRIDSEKSKDMFYMIGTNASETNWKKYSFKFVTVDMEGTNKDTINKLHDNGKFVICYISAGTYEDWRSDTDSFKESVKGNNLSDWEGEKWVDIRDESVLDIMKNRIKIAKDKKCDGIDFDNIDGYTNDTGFSITKDDQINFDIALAEYAHNLNLKTSLKNNLLLLNDLSSYYDFAVNEQCNQYNECDLYNDWLNSDKLVFNIEYKNVKDYKLYKNDNFHTYLMNIELNGRKYIKK